MKNICVIGAGTMGNGIAHLFAQNGFKVSLVDISENSLKLALENINKNLQRQVKKEVLTTQQALAAMTLINTSISLENEAKKADLVIEAVSENIHTKQSVFKTLSAHCQDHCILASNTSSISIDKIADVVKNQQNVIGMHFMNPVPIMPLVEIIKTPKTDAKVVNIIYTLCKELHKKPVLANDFPGFVANRILMPMINEAILSLEQGVAGVQEIDDIMTLGMAHPMGPLLLADFIGLDVCYSIMNVLHEGFEDVKYQPSAVLKKLVDEGKLGRKTGEGFYIYSTNPPQAKTFHHLT